VATTLCRMAQGSGQHFALGLVTCHPYSVRAVEAATGRACDRELTRVHARDLIEHSGIPYVQGCAVQFEGGRCLIDTQFYVDHDEVDAVLRGVSRWGLGPLEEGKEFIAFTFA
jgi:hypothetical protein